MAIAGFLFSPALYAQDAQQPAHEFSVHGGAGSAGLNYKPSDGTQKNSFGGQFGLGYRFFLNSKLGLVSGLEIAMYGAKFNLNQAKTRYTTSDFENETFEFRSEVNGYEEKQSALLLQIPLMVQYQTVGKTQGYVAAGCKIALPMSGKYKNSAASLNNSGYYSTESYEYTTQEFMGFGTFANRNNDEKLKLNPAIFVSVEAGVKWKLQGGFSLYTGAYLDYGLNNICKSSDPLQFVEYNQSSPRDFKINSILNSQVSRNSASQSLVSKTKPMAFGIKVSLAFGKSAQAAAEQK